MAYDSEEEKKLRESIARKTELAKEFAGNKEAMNKLKESIETLAPFLERLIEKARYEKLSDEEQELFNKITATLQQVQQSLSDANLLIFNDLFAKSHAYFFHVKKLAEEGNEDARKVYEKLLPSFKQAMGEGDKSPKTNN